MNEIQQEWRYMGRQQDDVYDVMKDQQWHTLAEVATAVDGRETSVSACIRNFRKASHGGYVVERKREDGEYLYRLLLGKDSQ